MITFRLPVSPAPGQKRNNRPPTNCTFMDRDRKEFFPVQPFQLTSCTRAAMYGSYIHLVCIEGQPEDYVISNELTAGE
ncbi:unnamed protein product [Protopolystoma xenopodis]|uniref:Uncharacterized protein n=1 Tax=Protopolystoma xenopodis TaxID=117903 RepID=A0A3S5A1Q2_9PLAT|nr:unnamed protein product [Protopolystoma xenopodis]